MKTYIIAVGNARPGQYYVQTIVAKSLKDAIARCAYKAAQSGLDPDLSVISWERA
jgi:hypothetical protein